MPLDTNCVVQIGAKYAGPVTIGSLALTIGQSYTVATSTGAGAGQASIFYAGTRTLASGATESLDLNGATLIDALGAPVTIAALKGIVLVAATANTTTLTIGNVANGIASVFGAATQSLTLQPGEILAKLTPSAAGYPIVAGTADLLKIANAAGAPATYDLILFGA